MDYSASNEGIPTNMMKKCLECNISGWNYFCNGYYFQHFEDKGKVCKKITYANLCNCRLPTARF